MNGKKRIDISPLTIISSIEKEVKELLPELSKAQKAKVISIQESIKLLHKKLSLSSQTNNLQQDIMIATPANAEMKENKSKLDDELTQLRQENIKLKSELAHSSHLLKETTKTITQQETSSNDLCYYYNEEKAKNSLLLLQVKTVEDNFKTLNKEYQALSERHEIVLKEMETLCQVSTEMKQATSSNRYKYEDLAHINAELKKKLQSYENNISTHTEDLKTLMKKNNNQRVRIEELEKTNKALNAEVNYKEERIKAIRIMNAKLETNTKRLINKWGSLTQIEEKNQQISQEANEAFDSLREMNDHLNYESSANKSLQMQLHQAINNNQELQQEIKKLSDMNASVKDANRELVIKNKELMMKYQEEFNTKEKKIMNSSYKGNNSLFESGDNDTSIPLEKLQPAELLLK